MSVRLPEKRCAGCWQGAEPEGRNLQTLFRVESGFLDSFQSVKRKLDKVEKRRSPDYLSSMQQLFIVESFCFGFRAFRETGRFTNTKSAPFNSVISQHVGGDGGFIQMFFSKCNFLKVYPLNVRYSLSRLLLETCPG